MASFLKSLLLLGVCYEGFLLAKDFGSYGHTFPVQEENLITYMQSKVNNLSESELAAVNEQIKNQAINSFQEPKFIKGLEEASRYRLLYFDPTVCANQDILDHEGHVIVQKGTQVNPLIYTFLGNDYLFFDGSKESHIAWAKQQAPNAKWILVKGRPLNLEERERRPVFFDQFGIITQKLNIRHIPAKVSQEGQLLKIEEFPIEEEKCKN
jgi:conjugal transfer pilus assembly protein TraW